MSEARPFFTVPGELWRRDPALNGCREDSISIFHVIAEASDRDWRLEVTPTNHAFSVRVKILDPERFRRWSEERINRALSELRARGCLLLATANDREWLEIPDKLAYCKGHKKQEPLAVPKQEALQLTGELALLPSGEPRIPVRVEEREIKNDSRAARRSNGHSAKKGRESCAVARGGSNASDAEKKAGGVFSAGERNKPDDDAWIDLCRFLNAGQLTSKELWDNGANWLKRLSDARVAVVHAVQQGLLLEKEGHQFANRGAWLTDQIENHTSQRTA